MPTFLIFVCFEAPDPLEGPEQLPFITSAIEIERSSLNEAVDLAILTWTTVTRNGSSGLLVPRLQGDGDEPALPYGFIGCQDHGID